MDRQTLQRIKDVRIEDIASELGIDVRRHMCRCPFHDDHHPSMSLSPRRNIAHCFVCGQSWDGIAMVREMMNLDFMDACRWIADHNNIWINTKTITKPQTPKPMKFLPTSYVDSKLSIDNTFCRSLVSNGILTEEQMQHASERYRLGKSADGGVIFWQIDEQQRVHDGKIMHYSDDCHRDHDRKPQWACNLLTKAGMLDKGYQSQKCLFVLHLIGNSESRNLGNSELRNLGNSENCKLGKPDAIAIVESEKTAIICSEIFPEYTWLATGGISCLSTDLLAPLAGRKVIIFPDTDTDGFAFHQWTDKARDASKILGTPFPVSNILEVHATADQKARKIDLADYLIEGHYNDQT